MFDQKLKHFRFFKNQSKVRYLSFNGWVTCWASMFIKCTYKKVPYACLHLHPTDTNLIRIKFTILQHSLSHTSLINQTNFPSKVYFRQVPFKCTSNRWWTKTRKFHYYTDPLPYFISAFLWQIYKLRKKLKVNSYKLLNIVTSTKWLIRVLHIHRERNKKIECIDK